MSGSLQVPYKCVYVGRVVRGRSVVVGYEDVHLVSFFGGCRGGIEGGRAVGGIPGQFKQRNRGTLRPLAAGGR